ncbi:phenylacetaldehyde oxime monooxygenase CYP71AN24-like [Prosopis cineraria]|uniref:phenylacetaldehyde oxime monooxygenase CYP71AN24-like n=1 Tax=Prosopis cineraria TaxID=364024 RepID=UPI00240F4AAB|nr:phenylacetaldehyde oxime monooxygenase CYP71AN24-like [Prosopis cineraria]
MAFLNATFYLYLLAFVTFLFVFKLTRPRKSKPYNLPPSPPKLPIIGNIHQLGTLPHRSFRDLSLKYGPLLWLQLGRIPALLVSSADLAREVLKNQDAVFASRFQSISAKTLLYGCKDIAYATYGESWRQKRKICVLELLSLKRVRSFQVIRDEEVAEMVNGIRRACASDNNCSVNISDLITATTNNIIFRCIIGQKYDPEESSGRFGTLARKEMIHLADLIVGDFFPYLGWIDVLSGKIQELRDTFKAIDGFFDQVTEDHKKVMKKDDEEKDFVDILLQLKDSDMLEFEPTKDDLKAIITDMFLGGNDTTSTTLEWILSELRRHPKIMKKVQEEVRKVVGSKSKVDEADINDMKYLKFVIKETLRLHPPAPFMVPRETIRDGKLGGYDIPSKTLIFVNTWAIQRDPEIWEKPEEFIPERFENTQIDFKGKDFEFIPFGSGKRICPGMAFGLASVEYELANLLYWFDWKLSQDGEIDMTETYGLTVKKKVPLFLELIPYSVQSQSG